MSDSTFSAAKPLADGFDKKWWSQSGLKDFLPNFYNPSIYSYTSKEYWHREKIRTLWREPTILAAYNELTGQIAKFKVAAESANLEIGRVTTSKEPSEVDFNKTTQVTTNMLEIYPDLENAAEKLVGLLADGLDDPN